MGGRQRAVRAPIIDFHVTAEHIAESIPKDSAHCMIADALKAAMPNAKFVSVDLATIRFTDQAAGRRYIYLTPRGAQDALIAFDQGERPEPFHVRAPASQMIKTGIARSAPKVKNDGDTSVIDAPPTRPRKRREPAKLVPTGAGGNTIPIKDGGVAPPVGPLAWGTTGRPKGTRRRREFGLRALIR